MDVISTRNTSNVGMKRMPAIEASSPVLVRIHLDEFDVAMLLSCGFEHGSEASAWSTPRRPEVDDEASDWTAAWSAPASSSFAAVAIAPSRG